MSSFLHSASTGNRNNFSGFVGYTFEVSRAVNVTHLGRPLNGVMNQNHTVGIWDGTTRIAHCIVTPQSPLDERGFKHEPIVERIVKLNPGVRYRIGSTELPGGDKWRDIWLGTGQQPPQLSVDNSIGAIFDPIWGTAEVPNTVYPPLMPNDGYVGCTFYWHNENAIWFLDDLMTMSSSGSHELGRDLDFQDDSCYRNLANKTLWTTGTGWTRAVNGSAFTGILDGKNYKIKNLYINRTATDYYGFFSRLSQDAQVKNIIFENPFVTINSYDGGVVCGRMDGFASIENCHVLNGQLAGTIISGISNYIIGTVRISNCSFDGTINCGNAGECGGIAGYIELTGTIIEKCKTSGTITGTAFSEGAGGIAGVIAGGNATTIIQDCYSEMTVPNVSNCSPILGRSTTTTPIVRRCWTNKNSGNFTIIRTGTITASNNYFDSTTTGLSSSNGAIARTTAQMRQLATFTSWNIATKANFNPENPTTWFIDENVDYPRLWFEYEPEIEPEPDELMGIATISNMSPRVGDTLTGQLLNSNNTGNLSYVWKADNIQVANGNTYMVVNNDIGKAIILEITSDIETGTIISNPTAPVQDIEEPQPTIKQIAWSDGSGQHFYIKYIGAPGTSIMTITSDPNFTPNKRFKTISLQDEVGSMLVEVSQEAFILLSDVMFSDKRLRPGTFLRPSTILRDDTMFRDGRLRPNTILRPNTKLKIIE